MDIETSTIQKIRITGAHALGPVDVYLEDIDSGKGKIVVFCAGKSWSAYWNAIGKSQTISTFFRGQSEDYIMGYFAPGIPETKLDGRGLSILARRVILQRRRGTGDECQEYGELEARELYDRTKTLAQAGCLSECPPDLMRALFGEEYWYLPKEASKPNPDYLYITRIIRAVQAALAELAHRSETANSPC